MFDDASPSIREMAMSFGGMSPITVIARTAMKRAVGRCAHRYSHTNTLNLKSRFASCTNTYIVLLLSYLLVYVRTNVHVHVGVVVAFVCCPVTMRHVSGSGTTRWCQTCASGWVRTCPYPRACRAAWSRTDARSPPASSSSSTSAFCCGFRAM